MKLSFICLYVTLLLFSCSKDNKNEDKIVNGVNVNLAVTTFNSYRSQGITGYPAVGPLTWNDTLSQAAYNYAKAKTEDVNTPSNIYQLSTGQMILDFPPALNFSRSANFALYYAYPANANVKDVIDAGFSLNNPLILSNLMNANAKQFGMGQFGDKWFVFLSN